MSLNGVCSARPRPAVQSSRKPFGSQWWARDVYHLRDGSDIRTLCGRDCSEWLTMGEIGTPTKDCCRQCVAVANSIGDHHGEVHEPSEG